MKKFYNEPEFSIVKVSAEDIMAFSDEVDINVEDFFAPTEE